MTQTVQHTTQKLIDLLPENEQYYRLDELRTWGFPACIVQRIKVELERNMAESMLLPKTDWANIDSDAVQHAWQQFVQAIRAEARLPASYARAVVETAAVDVLDMLTEPRKNIPDVIFGGDKELNFEQLSARTEAVVVYTHFTRLLLRYMQKRGLDTLSKDRCTGLIEQADAKLTANYSPLNWAQTLDPLFKLLDGSIDPALLRLFFKDKDQHQLAEVFDREDEELSRAEFIETLSSPVFIDKEPTDGGTEFKEEPKEESDEAQEMPAPAKDVNHQHQKGNSESGKEVREEPENLDSSSNEDFKNTSHSVKQENTASEKEHEEEAEIEREAQKPPTDDSVLHDAYTDSSIETQTNGGSSINAAFGIGEQDVEDDTEEQGKQRPESTSDPSSEEVIDSEEKVDPIWMHFMSEGEKEAIVSEEGPEDVSVPDFDSSTSSIEEPDKEVMVDLRRDDNSEKDADKLIKHLSEEQEYFVATIFDGSQQAYEKAVQKIASFDDWRKASKYIQNDIFRRNLVDMYSESAVDFTDRLQDYFSEKEN